MTTQDDDLIALLSTTEAHRWAEEFVKVFAVMRHSDGGAMHPTHWQQDVMLAWFANAIEVGRDAGREEGRADTLRWVDDAPVPLYDEAERDERIDYGPQFGEEEG